MFVEFFLCLRRHGVPVSLTELLDLLKALEQQVVSFEVSAFYQLARLILVKDEKHFDRFDRACAEYFEGVEAVDIASAIPSDWLRHEFSRALSEADKAKLQSLGGLDELLKQFKQRLTEQQKRHAGGNKWIGTGGTSPFGAHGYHPEGIRIGGGDDYDGARRAVKIWDKREFRDFDDNAEVGHRTMQMALRKLRRFARTGNPTELDLAGTISATAKRGGLLDLQFQAERHNAVKLLVLFDVGGSMDDHIYECQQLFSAVKAEFKHLEFFYFHNCPYEFLWRHNQRRFSEREATLDVIHTYASDYKLLIVGDATMGPYEIAYPGGSVEHWNEESGQVWLGRLMQQFPHAAWLNPQPAERWAYYASIGYLQQLMSNRMFPLTLAGLGQAIEALA